MFQAKINGKEFQIDSMDEGFLINGEKLNWDLMKISEGYFHILHQNKSYRAEVV